MQRSCFALCPSGSGHNSIRLWDAAALMVPETQAADPELLAGLALWATWWQAALRLCEQELVGRPAAVVSVVPELEEVFGKAARQIR